MKIVNLIVEGGDIDFCEEDFYETIEIVEISKESYNQLEKDSQELCALESHGVDNWCGYEDAMQSVEEEE